MQRVGTFITSLEYLKYVFLKVNYLCFIHSSRAVIKFVTAVRIFIVPLCLKKSPELLLQILRAYDAQIQMGMQKCQ